MSGPLSKVVWTLSIVGCAVMPASAQSPAALTCDPAVLDPASYALTMQGAEAMSGSGDAEEALRLDRRNLLAHGTLARQYVVAGDDARYADAAWQAVLDNGGAVAWTATLHDVDAKSYFVLAFDRQALRVYRYGELAGPFERTMGMLRFAGADRERFWRALGGCIDPAARPEAVIPWSDVREIKGGNWVLWFKLARKVQIASDNGKRKGLDEIKVNLHGATGTFHANVTIDYDRPERTSVRPYGMGPFDFNQRVRYTIAKHVDPQGRIKLPKASRSAGW